MYIFLVNILLTLSVITYTDSSGFSMNLESRWKKMGEEAIFLAKKGSSIYYRFDTNTLPIELYSFETSEKIKKNIKILNQLKKKIEL